jgi:hypothetical protein
VLTGFAISRKFQVLGLIALLAGAMGQFALADVVNGLSTRVMKTILKLVDLDID